MIVLNCILLMLLSATLGAVTAGAIAIKSVEWYRMSPREGQSGYFVVIMGLFGLIAGGLIGLVCGIGFAPDTFHAFGLAFGTSAGVIVGAGCVILVISRALADVPPTIGGETLFLIVEVRAAGAVSPFGVVNPRISLGSLSGRTLRKSEYGPLWTSSATAMDGAWVAVGAALHESALPTLKFALCV